MSISIKPSYNIEINGVSHNLTEGEAEGLMLSLSELLGYDCVIPESEDYDEELGWDWDEKNKCWKCWKYPFYYIKYIPETETFSNSSTTTATWFVYIPPTTDKE